MSINPHIERKGLANVRNTNQTAHARFIEGESDVFEQRVMPYVMFDIKLCLRYPMR